MKERRGWKFTMAPHLHQSKVLAAVWKHLVTEKMRWVGVIELLRMYLDLHRTLKMEISSPEGRKVSRSCVLWSLTLSRVFSVRFPASSNPAVIQYLVSGGGQLWGQPQQSVCYFFLRILRKFEPWHLWHWLCLRGPRGLPLRCGLPWIWTIKLFLHVLLKQSLM